MAGDVTRTVRIVYEVDGVEQATADQQSLAGALEQTGAALNEQTGAVENAEQAMGALSDVATRSEQATARMQQQLQSLAGGLNGLASILGTDTDAGALLGRMGQFASTGIQLGMVFGPAGAVVGGIVGATLPALDSLIERLSGAGDESVRARDEIDDLAASLLDQGRAARSAADDLDRWTRAAANRQQQARADRIRRGEFRDEGDIRLGAERLRELGGEEGSTAAEIFGGMAEDLDAAAQALADGVGGDTSSGGRRGGRGGRGSREPAFRSDGGAALRALAAQGESDAARAERMGRPSDFGIMGADLQRQQRNRGFGGGRGADPVQAQIASLEQIKDKQQEIHDAQMQRIEQQVEAWTGAGQKIGSTLYNAFQTAATGQESLDVAVVKGFKGLAIQFGGQMVNEGIAALLTAAGNTVANPPMAATKAAEGAGKLALGIGLGAAGAAIPVPSSGAQARTPRLGPAEDSSRGGGSTIVNMNAPSVVTGSGSQVGRLIGRSLDDARQRFGRAA